MDLVCKYIREICASSASNRRLTIFFFFARIVSTEDKDVGMSRAVSSVFYRGRFALKIKMENAIAELGGDEMMRKNVSLFC